MNSEANADVLQSTLDELTHLLINPSRLNLLNDRRVGSGGYGEVYLATLDGTSKVAIKQLKIIQAGGTNTRAAMRLTRELKIWARAKHPNVLRLVGYHLSESYACAQLVSPYMENGNITEYMKRTQAGVKARLRFVRGITLGMAYLHSCDPPICHGDLKPANVLISDKLDAVLCDFGLATFVENSGDPSGLTTSRSIKGSLRYMSPELFHDDEAKHTLESDIWAWACTIFETITDCIPYANSRSDGSLMVAVLQGASPGSTKLLSGLAPKVDICSRLTLVILQNLVPKCWSIDPKKRQSSSSVLQCLKYVELGNSDPPPSPDQPPHDEEKADIWATSQPTTAKLSILSKHELEERGYYRMQLISRAEGWVSEDAPEPEVVLRCHEDGFHLSVAPNGKWLAVNFQATSQLWNLEHLSSPPLDLPARGLWARYEWSPDSQHLACFDGNDLYTWSTESQSNKGHFNGRPVWSAAWFSNGEALAVESVGQISIMSTKSGQFQMGSDWMLATSRAHQASPMATIPVDCVGGRRIVVMTGCQQISDDVNGVRDRFWVPGWASNKREATIVNNIIVYDTDAQKALARAPHDDGVQNVTISRNGEFVLLSHHNASPALWRLKVTDGDGIWNIQITLTYSFSMPPNFLPSTHVYWVSFGGDNDEWVISATTQGHIIIWDTQSPEPFRAIEGLPYPEYSSHPKVVYCPTKDKSSSLMLLYGQDRREVVVWKWWKVSSDWIMVI